MDGINLISLQDEILAHVRSEFPNYEVLEDVILDDEYLLKINNNVKPFVIIEWGGLARQFTNASFAGVRHDEYRSDFELIALAPAPKIARRVLNMFLDKLIGWPIQGSQLTPSGTIDNVVSRDGNGRPHLYISVGTLSFRFNSSNPEGNITP